MNGLLVPLRSCVGGDGLWIIAIPRPVRFGHSHAGRIYLPHGRFDALFKLTEPEAELIKLGPVRCIAILHEIQEDHYVIPLIAKSIETRI